MQVTDLPPQASLPDWLQAVVEPPAAASRRRRVTVDAVDGVHVRVDGETPSSTGSHGPNPGAHGSISGCLSRWP